MIKSRTVSYAQNREDIILSGFFDDNEKGFYVDVGANEPTHESVTKYFYDRGWSGINLEPIPALFDKLTKERRRDINVCVGVGSKERKAMLHYYPHGDGLSTLSDKMANDYKDKPSDFTKESQELSISILPLKKILKEHANGKTISFLKVDVEGLEYDVLASNDWKEFKPQVICIEANHVDQDWRPLLKENGYSLVHFDGLNEYYADDASGRAAKFDYVKAVIFKEPIVNFRLLEDFEQYEKTIDWLDDSSKDLARELALKDENIRGLNRTIAEMETLRKHLKKSMKHRARVIDSKITRRLDKNAVFKAVEIEADELKEREVIDAIKKYDTKNFQDYASTLSKTKTYKAYLKTKRVIRKSLKKAKR